MNSVAVIKTIDREKITPFLLRCFWKANKSRTEFEYKDAAKQILPADEAQIYTWPDATLRELSDVLSAAIPEARRSNIVFSLVYPDRYIVDILN
jgi:histone deacetylase complex subunit SAP18